jgi:hypothetical protein
MSRKRKPAEPNSPGEVLRKIIAVAQGQLCQGDECLSVYNQPAYEWQAKRDGGNGLRFARVTCTSAEFWLDLQRDVDLMRPSKSTGRV